jgi:trafficking protein particle complex subunit 11
LPSTPSEEIPLASGQFSALYSDYFGVRNIANKTIDSGSDQQIIALVQEMESKFNYPVSHFHPLNSPLASYDSKSNFPPSPQSAIINLLGQAMSQFKVYRCGRVRKKCAVMMADEYFKSGEYTKALT